MSQPENSKYQTLEEVLATVGLRCVWKKLFINQIINPWSVHR